MATIKAGTYRFNSEIFVDPDRSVTEYFYFTRMTSTSEVVLQTGINVRTENGDVVVYYCRDDSVFVGVYRGAWAIEECRTITITEGSEVSPEFYTWFTANAVEVVEHTVSGVWRFKDELSLPTSRIFQQITFSLNTFLNLYGVSVNAVCDSILVDYAGAAHNVVSTIPDISSVYPLPAVLTVYSLPGNHEEFEGWNDYAYDEGIKTVDFGTEPQAVSAEFYEWFRKNARPAFATIWYNGGKIANLFGSQTATLKCAGMKMESDVVVEVAEQSGGGGASAPVLAPLTVTENGTYYPTYEAATVTWDENTEYDGTIEVDGVTLRYKKVANLTVPDDVSALENPEYCFAVTFPDGTVQSTPLSELRLGSADGIYLANDISFAVVWVKDATFVNAAYGASLEDDTVYVTDYLWLAHGDEYAGASFSLTAQGQKIDGFSSVTVEVESTGGGLAINGIIEQYKVNAGATVNAGDFVEFVNKCGYGEFHTGTTSDLSACKLDNSRVLVAYVDGGNSSYGTAAVLAINGGVVSVGAEKVFSSALTRDICVCALSENKCFVAYGKKTSSYYPAYAAVFTIDNDTISVGSSVVISSTSTDVSTIDAIALSNNTVLLAVHTAVGSSKSSYICCCNINGTSVTKGTSVTLGTSSNPHTNLYLEKLTESKALLRSYYSSNYRLMVVTIDGTTVSVGSSTTVKYCYVSAISETMAIAVFNDSDNSSYFSAMLLSISGESITKGTPVVLREESITVNDMAALSENKHLVTFDGKAMIISVDGANISTGADVVFNEDTSRNYLNIIPFSGSSVFIALVGGGLGKYASLSIDGDNITVADASGTFVQPATGRLHNVGVAATGGTAGEMVDVYVVG